MIFLEFNEERAKEVGLPTLIQTAHPMIDIPEEWKYCAERIFDIKFGVTGYWKDRYGTGYQFSSEEEVVLRLKAVLV